MKYELIHQNATGKITTSVNQISFLAFIKHATFAGIGSPFFKHLPFRYLSLFFEFVPSFFRSGHFNLLPELANDPTETAYMSNKIGRAFADYLSKRVYGAKFTHNYECAMHLKGYPITGNRPDFYCDTMRTQFAVESKGYSARSISDTAMIKHKTQSKTGPLSVNFSIASVAYNLYKEPRIKFYDPQGDNVLYDNNLNSELREMYYRNVLYFIEHISYSRIQSEFADYFAYNISYPFMAISQILVHKAILKRNVENFEWLTSIEQKGEENDEFYIDVDGIGLTNRSLQTR
ncbi:hypothetical protein [Pectobacterium versatile]|uniref:hypothetical protein n=1 Tax=Pectobacterium versatile TaxID=2488639 RepID=UPI00208E4D68|nr:hypothetical protein [Pectobacterium versatile]MCO4311349.1 hypothetical protein [Pectobacterium versatile]